MGQGESPYFQLHTYTLQSADALSRNSLQHRFDSQLLLTRFRLRAV
jgi:hypothetical protein